MTKTGERAGVLFPAPLQYKRRLPGLQSMVLLGIPSLT
jgi:hypothetical protein